MDGDLIARAKMRAPNRLDTLDQISTDICNQQAECVPDRKMVYNRHVESAAGRKRA